MTDLSSNIGFQHSFRGKETKKTDDGVHHTNIGKLSGSNFEYFICKNKTVIGRNSSHGKVDVNIGISSYVSRNHLQIDYERGRFFLVCKGKNGVFVDGQFQRLGAHPLPMDRTCVIRFPSTSIRLNFTPFPNDLEGCYEKLIEQDRNIPDNVIGLRDSVLSTTANIIHKRKSLSPEISSPDDKLVSSHPVTSHISLFESRGFLSAPPSPTATISAVNSCPSSPNRRHLQHHHEQVTQNLNAAASAIAASVSEDNSGSEGIDSKPPFSYAQLIIQAISSASNHQLTLSGIYGHITKNYPYYRTADKGWQNSIRHNLSLNRYFVKVPRSQEESGKGSFWRVDPASERKLVEQAWRKRRQRTVPCFCTPLTSVVSTITRSAPVSPEQSNPLSPSNSLNGFTSLNNTARPLEDCSKVQLFQLASRYAQSAPGSPSGNGNNIRFQMSCTKSLAQSPFSVGTQSNDLKDKLDQSFSDESTKIENNCHFPDTTKVMDTSQLSLVMPSLSSTVLNSPVLTTIQQSNQVLQQSQVVMVTCQSGHRLTQAIPINIGSLVADQNSLGNSGVPFVVPGNQHIAIKRVQPSENDSFSKRMKLESSSDQDRQSGQK